MHIMYSLQHSGIDPLLCVLLLQGEAVAALTDTEQLLAAAGDALVGVEAVPVEAAAATRGAGAGASTGDDDHRRRVSAHPWFGTIAQ
jgi:hypothetical protein